MHFKKRKNISFTKLYALTNRIKINSYKDSKKQIQAQELYSNFIQLQKAHQSLCTYLRRSIQDTEELETALLKKTREINSLSSIALFPLKGSAVKGILKSPIKTEMMKTTHRFHHSLSPSKICFPI